MRELRIGSWFLLVTMVAVSGCDTAPATPRDAGRDTGVTLLDSGNRDTGTPPVDTGVVVMDSGNRDAGPTAGRCGPVGGPCDISVPSSCPTGEACLLEGGTAAGWTAACFPAGTGVDGTACSPGETGQCAEGFGCSQDENVCRRWCCATADCNSPSPTGQICRVWAGFPTGRDAGICAIPDVCTLVPPQTGCDPGEGCYAGEAGTTSCVEAGTAVDGEACEYSNSCAAGFACISTSATDPSLCRQFCDTTTPACGTGFRCGGVTGFPEGVGVCVPS